jgi:hypothetical protein
METLAVDDKWTATVQCPVKDPLPGAAASERDQ